MQLLVDAGFMQAIVEGAIREGAGDYAGGEECAVGC